LDPTAQVGLQAPDDKLGSRGYSYRFVKRIAVFTNTAEVFEAVAGLVVGI